MACGRLWSSPRSAVAGRIEAIGWGLFLIWVGSALLLDVGWGIGLLGVGVLTLTMQGVRRGSGLSIEGFWVLVGSVLALAGLWELAAADVAFVPVVLIAIGVLVVASVLLVKSD
jgi:hypothetical protein